jgi:hypothetical protein
MREILYRGKTKEGVWKYGYYSQSSFYETSDNQYFIEEWDSFLREMAFTEITPETVGEYTGLSAAVSYRGERPEDLRIFEGDVVLRVNAESSGIINSAKYFITFERGGFMINRIEPWPFRMEGWLLHDDHRRLMEYEGHFEIIGNIYDAPELLKGVTE